MTVNVLFVCLGNICRSPTAHGLFQYHVDQAGLTNNIHVDSAGTGAWHAGNPPDDRAQSSALEKGYDIGGLRARQVTAADFKKYDYILAMDKQNLIDLRVMCPTGYHGVLALFLEAAGLKEMLEVPDPYYGGQEHFEHVIQLVERGAENLLARIQKEHTF
ncbi:MAG: low molecular weight protein-tyrosine-phosphatase [Cellvibrionaceae bacterium]